MAIALGRRPPSSDVVFFAPLVGGGLLSLLGLRPLLGGLGEVTLDDDAGEPSEQESEVADAVPRVSDGLRPRSVGDRLAR